MAIIGNLTVLNVQDYGAQGKGTGDDSDAINKALADVPQSTPNVPGGAIVYFPQGNYVITKPLMRLASGTRCIGEGRAGTTISIDPLKWTGTPSPADPSRSFMLDLQTLDLTDCTVEDITLDGEAGELTTSASGAAYCGILCSARSEIIRVSLLDIYGWALWIYGQKAVLTRVIDCDADLGQNHTPGAKSLDCIGGGGYRTQIVRFHWKPTLMKNTALDFTNGGGTISPPFTPETSVDIIDCTNESAHDILLEGCVQSTVRGCRFYGNILLIKTDAKYPHNTITNPADILVADNLFVGGPGAASGGSCKVHFDGGAFCPNSGKHTFAGGRVAVIGNSFVQSGQSAIEWGGDIGSTVTGGATSVGGSVISDNRIYEPNQSGGNQTPAAIDGDCQSLGTAYGCGITVLSSNGLTIARNTIVDDSSPQNMVYAIELVRADAPLGNTQRILVQGNLCGAGKTGTFYYTGVNASNTNPWPILLDNTNQESGYDAAASGSISSGTAWPPIYGYPYNALVTVNGSSVTGVSIDGQSTNLLNGAFYVPAGHTITITWSGTRPQLAVFRCL